MKLRKVILATSIALLSAQGFTGNPNSNGVDQTARDAANAAQATADANTAAITALQNPTAPDIGTDLTTTQGGIVACTVNNGDSFNLIASARDDSIRVEWSNITRTAIGTSAQSDISGANNTTAIIAQRDFRGGAAKVCRDKTDGGFTDWYLPSKDELNCLFNNRVAIGGFSTIAYWSSTESSSFNAFQQEEFEDGSQGASPKDNTLSVRCVRAFKP